MTTFRNCMRVCRASTVAALLAAGCSSGNQVTPESETESANVDALALELQKLSSDLVLGSSGEEVRTLHKYLERYGYFPSSNLSSEYENWQPVVSQDPAFDDVFDERTQEAVMHLQYQASIEQTGYVDAATRDALRLKRESVIDRIDALVGDKIVEKFAFEGGKVSPTTVTFRFENTVAYDRRHAIRRAFQTWIAETNLGFDEIVNGTPTMVIKFEPSGINGPYKATSPALGSDITFDSTDLFSSSGTPPAGVFDMESVALQAIGRAIGLHLSSIPNSVMYATLTPGPSSQRRDLFADDKVAISALYDGWAKQPGRIRHVAVGRVNGTTEVWAVGDTPTEGGLGIHKWNGSDWARQPNIGGVRVAVGITGPWVVQTDGKVLRRINGTWQDTQGKAKDVAASATGDVWAVGLLDSRVYKWSGSAWTKESDAINGEAHRIAVTSVGIPWVVQADGDIYERSTSNPASGGWIHRAGGSGCGKDIGAFDHVWLIGCNKTSGGYGIAVWNAQPALGDAPAKSEWKFVSGGALTVGVGPTGPWIGQDDRDVFELKKTN
jgi:peptidoglycan hydrolase-like protein with peptidoglycan-binding domain